MVQRVLRRGLKNGLQITWELAKAIVPVYFVITFLKYSPLLDMLSNACRGFMGNLGLPGEAALPLVLGNVLNLYAAIGAIEALALSSKQITIIAVMLLFSHSLFVELAVARKAGVKVLPVLTIRITMAVVAALTLNLVL